MLSIPNEIIARFWDKLINFLPDLFVGLIVLLIGFFIANLLKRLVLTLLRFFRIDAILEKTRLTTRSQVKLWGGILAEVLRWTIIILFLTPTLEIWGLARATGVINQFLFFLPNVIVAVIMGFVGSIVANLAGYLAKNGLKSLGSHSATTLAMFARSTIIFITVLIILNQLGVAQDLIRILFTGIVAMLAIAGGLAFGLGGKDMAKEILEGLKKKIK